jgi:hypothetical protein
MRRSALIWSVALAVLGHGEFAAPSYAAPAPGPPIVGDWEGNVQLRRVPARQIFIVRVARWVRRAAGRADLRAGGAKPGRGGRLRLRGGPPAPDGVFTLVPDTWLERSEGANLYGLSGRIGGNGAVAEGKL